MKSTLSTLKSQSILILGLGREGISTYKFLRSHFPDKKIALADKKPLEKLDTKLISLLHKDENIVLQLEDKYLSNLSTSDIIFKSPGIPASLPAISQALSHNTKLTSNTQLFFDILEEKGKDNLPHTKYPIPNTPYQIRNTKYPIPNTPYPIRNTKFPTIAITGTKGKSTTAALIHHVLQDNNLEAVLLGNIGTPPLDKIDKIQPRTINVLELSCHQLAKLTHSPHIAVVQEITSEHLDYYSTTEEYVEAKSAICRYQNKNDIVIYNENYPKTKEIAHLSPGTHITHNSFISKQKSEHKETPLWQDYPNLPGKHNENNIIPAIIIGQMFGLTDEQIRHSISNFQSLPHRLQLVSRIDGIRYYNDSLSTTPEATIAALNAFENTPIVLIAGGHERHQDFSELVKVILGVEKKTTEDGNVPNNNTKIKALILLPTTGQRIWEEIEKIKKEREMEQIIEEDDESPTPHTPYPATHFAETMLDAIKIAKKYAMPGDIVLLSPASASFNSFKDYEDRGEQFGDLVI